MDTLLDSSAISDLLEGIIYVIINLITNKVYVGQTKKSFNKRYRNGEWWNNSHNSQLKQDVIQYGLAYFRVYMYASTNLNDDEIDTRDYFRNNSKYSLYNGLGAHMNGGSSSVRFRPKYKIGVRAIFKSYNIDIDKIVFSDKKNDNLLELITKTSSGSTKDGHAAKDNAKLSKTILETTGVTPTVAKLTLVKTIIDKIITELPTYGYQGGSIGRLTGNLRSLTNGIARNV